MTTESFLRELEKAIDRAPGSISVSNTMDEVGWDSMAEIAFVSLVDRKLGVQLDAKQVTACKTVADLIKLLRPGIID